MTFLRRAPREVYRVYSEDEFLEGEETAATSGSHLPQAEYADQAPRFAVKDEPPLGQSSNYTDFDYSTPAPVAEPMLQTKEHVPVTEHAPTPRVVSSPVASAQNSGAAAVDQKQIDQSADLQRITALQSSLFSKPQRSSRRMVGVATLAAVFGLVVGLIAVNQLHNGSGPSASRPSGLSASVPAPVARHASGQPRSSSTSIKQPANHRVLPAVRTHQVTHYVNHARSHTKNHYSGAASHAVSGPQSASNSSSSVHRAIQPSPVQIHTEPVAVPSAAATPSRSPGGPEFGFEH